MASPKTAPDRRLDQMLVCVDKCLCSFVHMLGWVGGGGGGWARDEKILTAYFNSSGYILPGPTTVLVPQRLKEAKDKSLPISPRVPAGAEMKIIDFPSGEQKFCCNLFYACSKK